jgi:hypothetical protein
LEKRPDFVTWHARMLLGANRCILKVLKKLNLPQNQYVVWGSGPLAIRAIRENKDIDLLVPKQLWNQLAQKLPAHQKK